MKKENSVFVSFRSSLPTHRIRFGLPDWFGFCPPPSRYRAWARWEFFWPSSELCCFAVLCSNLFWTKFLTDQSRLADSALPPSHPLYYSRFFSERGGYLIQDGKAGFRAEPVFGKTGLLLKKQNPKYLVSFILSYLVHLCLKRPSSAFASDISARATRAYLSWCGLAFSERLRWKEMSRSGKAPATIWGEEGILSPASGSSSQW